MADIASLGISVDSGQVRTGTADLDKLASAAARAEGASKGVAGAAREVGSALTAEAAAMTRASVTANMHAAALRAEAMAARATAFQQRNLIFQLNDTVVSLASGMSLQMVALQQGSQIFQNGIGNAFRSLGGLLSNLLTRFWPIGAALAVIGLGVAGLTDQVQKATGKSVSFGDVLLGVWQTIVDGITRLVGPAISKLVGWFGQLIDWISPGVKVAGNFIIGAFVGAFTTIKDTWSLLPAALGDFVISAANGVLQAVEGMLNKSRAQIVKFLLEANGALSVLGLGGAALAGAQSLAAGSVNLPKITNPWRGAGNYVAGAAGRDMSSALSTDYMGQFFGAVSEHAVANMNNRLAETDDKLDKAGKKGKTLADKLTDAQKAAVKLAQSVEGALGSALGSLFSGPVSSLQDGMDKVLGSLAQLGQQNLQNVFNGMLGGAANDNAPQSWAPIARAVKEGAQAGTKGGFGDLLKGIPGGAGTVSAGLGGLGIGYQTQNPLMGALGGAISGAAAGPWGAVIGGLAGLVGGLLGMNEELEKSRHALREQKTSIREFIAASDAKPVDQYTAAVRQYNAQAAEFIKLAQAAGDNRLVQKLKDAERAYAANLRARLDLEKLETRFDDIKQDAIDAERAHADALQSTIDRTRDFISSLSAFRDGLKLDKNYSTLSPEGRLEEAQRQYDLIVKKARLGDATAQGQLSGSATAYLDAAKGYYGSSARYTNIFDAVEKSLGGVIGSAQTRLDSAKLQLDATNKSLRHLGGIEGKVQTTNQILERLHRLELAAAKEAGKDAKDLVKSMRNVEKWVKNGDLKRPVAA
jgi:hypothetical protein